MGDLGHFENGRIIQNMNCWEKKNHVSAKSHCETLKTWKFPKSTKKWKMDDFIQNHTLNDNRSKKVRFLTFLHYRASKKGSKNSRSSMYTSEVFVDFGHFWELGHFWISFLESYTVQSQKYDQNNDTFELLCSIGFQKADSKMARFSKMAKIDKNLWYIHGRSAIFGPFFWSSIV